MAAALVTTGRRWVAHGLAVLARLAMLPGIAAVGPLYTGSRPAPAGPAALVVTTQNLEDADPLALAAAAQEVHTEILVLTDAAAASATVIHDTTLGRELHHRIGLTGNGVEGSVVFSRYPLSASVDITAGADSRMVTALVPHLGKVDIVALHPRPPYETRAWMADYQAINDFLSSRYRDGGGLVVIAGDLNATLDHPRSGRSGPSVFEMPQNSSTWACSRPGPSGARCGSSAGRYRRSRRSITS